ncbi:UNVERIFIED_CONTAM: DNA (cytosine-5-)-methyltransferase [Streptococcus canis]|uniref:DNA cytosine methyltransferase n=1 Tax=Streptococcus canis TaxID=1329 RepID=UPI0010CA3544|nr:DNA (cytosine-5-)-methyltransferase [Streptococcus canis]VTR80225.1 DNA (cytosine-5-)-methyltransferase [Streptococcus canis]
MEKKQNKPLTLGSLFDGSGGFPLGGILTGITPIWASEVEPFPIRVTTRRFPNMKHLGDVSKIKGNEIEPVDIITFGSPCQDMSIAGKRAGLSGSRSNLFYEAIRIIKEMREETHGEKPRYIVWENVPGAFSSNKGEDFFSVLKEICGIKGHKIDEARPKKWQNAGFIMAGDFSLAWRVFDAQYWGVPQRRRRIYLVCDFNGESAGKILFESEGMPWHLEKSKCPWQRTATDSKGSIRSSVTNLCLNDQGGQRMDVHEEKSGTITASVGNHPPLVFENHGQDSRFKGPIDISNTIGASLGTGGNNQPFVVEDKVDIFDVRITSENTKNHRANIYETDVARTINTGQNSPEANQGGLAIVYCDKTAGTLCAMDGPKGVHSEMASQGKLIVEKEIFSTSKNSHHTEAMENLANTLVASDYKDPPVVNDVEGKRYIVRRLTPKECGRLQGFPDGWCDGLETENPSSEELNFWTEVFETYRKVVTKATKPRSEKQIRKWLANPHTDSAEYKMWGNGVALPNVCFVFAGIKHLNRLH